MFVCACGDRCVVGNIYVYGGVCAHMFCIGVFAVCMRVFACMDVCGCIFV